MRWYNWLSIFLLRVRNFLWRMGAYNPLLACLLLCCIIGLMVSTAHNLGPTMPWPWPDGGNA